MGQQPTRPQAHRLSWPWTQSQVEGLDNMLQSLFRSLRAVTDRATNGTDSGVVAGTYGSASKTITATVSHTGVITAMSDQNIGSAALTKTDDTNVTATLTGTPTSALLQAVNVALGWTGLLSLLRGGTGADLSGIAKGGVIVGTAAGTVGIKVVGSDAQVLTADAASTGGVKWAAASAFSPSQTEAYISLRIL